MIKCVANNADRMNDIDVKEYRALTGQLAWAAEMTRPDLCFDARELSTRNKEATYSDVKKANKVLKKAQKETPSEKKTVLQIRKGRKLAFNT